jgi:ubiquinone/menaquinone biosynthesis C-methylase UbiE
MYPAEYARWLLNPLRHLIFPVRSLVRRLKLKPADQVLEIGSGPGYFSPAVARAIPHGTLTLFDAQSEMLAMAEVRLKARGLSNFDCFEGDAAALPFADNSFDVAFMVAVLGEVPDRQGAMNEAARVLKPGGRLVIAELPGDPDFVRRKEVKVRARNAGLTLERCTGVCCYFICSFMKAG